MTIPERLAAIIAGADAYTAELAAIVLDIDAGGKPASSAPTPPPTSAEASSAPTPAPARTIPERLAAVIAGADGYTAELAAIVLSFVSPAAPAEAVATASATASATPEGETEVVPFGFGKPPAGVLAINGA